MDNIITVAAIDSCGALVNTSGYGQEADIAAPGDNILVKLPESDYDYDSGTSVAAAYVSGVAGLIFSLDNGFTPQEVKDLIIKNGTVLKSLDGKIFSGSCINAGKCLKNITGGINYGR